MSLATYLVHFLSVFGSMYFNSASYSSVSEVVESPWVGRQERDPTPEVSWMPMKTWARRKSLDNT